MQSFENLRAKYDLEKHDFFRYLQARDYYEKEIKDVVKRSKRKWSIQGRAGHWEMWDNSRTAGPVQAEPGRPFFVFLSFFK